MGPTIYIISVTDNLGRRVSKRLRRYYRMVAELYQQPLMGYWLDEQGEYLDVSIAVQYIRGMAIWLGHEYEQRAITTIRADGTYGTVSLKKDKKHVPPEVYQQVL